MALLNVMEERDIQVRGYTLRLPLDVLLVATANPEDYTNRGRIITPLKDRFGAEVRTHYPLDVDAEVDVVRQEAELVAEVGEPLLEILARFVRRLRESAAIDQRSGVSARFAVAAAETVAAAALRRSALTGEEPAVARPVDLQAVPSVLRGKLEFEPGEEGRETEHLVHLLRRAVAETARDRFAGLTRSRWPTRSRPGTWSRPASVCRPATCWPRCPSCRSCTTWPPAPGPIPRRIRRAGSRPRSSWRWRRSTCPSGWPRTPTTRARCTADDRRAVGVELRAVA